MLSRFKSIENQLQAHMHNLSDGSSSALKRQFCDPSATLTDINGSCTTENRDPPVFITERSLQTDYEVFTKMLASTANLNGMELAVYRDWYDMLLRTSTPLNGIIHVNQTPGECLHRIQKRNRSGEDAISLDYLQKLDNALLDWMGRAHCPVLSITTGGRVDDGERHDLLKDEVVESCANQIIDFVSKIRLT
jgi:deoxyadenosine/deoxycytidine kinase